MTTPPADNSETAFMSAVDSSALTLGPLFLDQDMPLPLYHPTPEGPLLNLPSTPQKFSTPLLNAFADKLRLFLELPDMTCTAKALPPADTEMPPWPHEPEMDEALYTLLQLAMMDFLIMTPPLSPKTTQPSLDSTTSTMNIEK
jgi:hypothetical protein